MSSLCPDSSQFDLDINSTHSYDQEPTTTSNMYLAPYIAAATASFFTLSNANECTLSQFRSFKSPHAHRYSRVTAQIPAIKEHAALRSVPKASACRHCFSTFVANRQVVSLPSAGSSNKPSLRSIVLKNATDLMTSPTRAWNIACRCMPWLYQQQQDGQKLGGDCRQAG
jgi:hypothetical protein